MQDACQYRSSDVWGIMPSLRGYRGPILQRYSAEDRERLIRKYHTSDQSKAAFCRSEQVNLGRFCGWLSRYSTRIGGFAEVVVSGGACPHRGCRAPGPD